MDEAMINSDYCAHMPCNNQLGENTIASKHKYFSIDYQNVYY